MSSPGYIGAVVTLTTANTNYSLLALLQAIEVECPATAREVVLQSTLDNAAAVIAIGDDKISGTRYGYKLQTGESRTYRGTLQHVLLGNIWLRSNTNGAKLAVEVMLC